MYKSATEDCIQTKPICNEWYCLFVQKSCTTKDGAKTLSIMGFQLPTSTGERRISHLLWCTKLKVFPNNPSPEKCLFSVY